LAPSPHPKNNILSPPRINPAGFLTQFSFPDSLNHKRLKKITGQLHACLHVSLLSNQSSLFYYPFAAPPSFLLPSPLVAIAIAVAGAVLAALTLLAAAAAAVACSACACTKASRSSLAATKNVI
jgi:hypothetical protein